MDIYKIASLREARAARLYNKLAKTAKNEKIKEILKELSKEELDHFGMVKTMEAADHSMLADLDVDHFKVPGDIEDDSFFENPEVSQLDLYRKVREFEFESWRFYEELFKHAKTPELRKVLVKLIDEEKRHYNKINEVVTFVENGEVLKYDAEFGLVRQT